MSPRDRRIPVLRTRGAPVLAGLLLLGLLPAAVAPPATAQTSRERTYAGILLPGRTALIKSKHPERVSEVRARVGTSVREGTLLIQLADEEERVRLDRAEAVAAKTLGTLERTRRLHEGGGASDEALEDAELEHRLAVADAELARIALEELAIKAPFDGVVAERYVDPGTSVEEGDVLVRITAMSPLKVEVLLPESALPSLAGLETVTLVPAHPETTITIRLPKQMLVVDAASGTFPLLIEVDNRDHRLIPGTSCQVILPATGP